jgi:hypothetical protein
MCINSEPKYWGRCLCWKSIFPPAKVEAVRKYIPVCIFTQTKHTKGTFLGQTASFEPNHGRCAPSTRLYCMSHKTNSHANVTFNNACVGASTQNHIRPIIRQVIEMWRRSLNQSCNVWRRSVRFYCFEVATVHIWGSPYERRVTRVLRRDVTLFTITAWL